MWLEEIILFQQCFHRSTGIRKHHENRQTNAQNFTSGLRKASSLIRPAIVL